MAIAPIDLQTLYSQLDKVGKTYGSQAQALQMQNAITDVEKAKQQLEEKKKILWKKLLHKSFMVKNHLKKNF